MEYACQFASFAIGWLVAERSNAPAVKSHGFAAFNHSHPRLSSTSEKSEA